MLRPTRWVAAILTALLVHGCATGARVRVDYDPKQDFQALRTYAWAAMTEEERQEKARNSLTHERIRAAIDAALAARGYQPVAAERAEFLVTHTVIVEQRTQVRDSHVSVGYGRYGPHGGVGVSYGFPVDTTIEHYKVGTLVIDVIDARQKRLIWRGSGERTLDEAQTPEQRTAVINATVNEILERFPPGGKKTR